MPKRLLPLGASLLVAGALTAADPVLLVGGYDPAVRAFSLSPDGVLHPLAVSPVGRNPSFLAVSADARTVYACDEVRPGRVVACAFDRGSGTLRPSGSASSGGAGPCFVAIHPSGRWLFTANYGDGRVAALPLASDGAIGEPASVVEAGANAHMTLPDAAGTVVHVPCKGADRIAVCRFDAGSGILALAAPVATTPGTGPRHLVRSADGARAWLAGELASTVLPMVMAADGSCTLGAPVTTLPLDWNGRNTAGGITLAGDQLLVSNRGHDSIALFNLDTAGIPHPAGHATVGRTPRHLAVSPDGRHVVVACQDADRVEVLRRDDGRLLPVGSVAVPRPAFVGFVP
jgi:6-phosphogluconolactonase